MPGHATSFDAAEMVEHLFDVHKTREGDPQASEAVAAPAHDLVSEPAPLDPAPAPSPSRNIPVDWVLVAVWTGIGVWCLCGLIGAALLVWWATG